MTDDEKELLATMAKSGFTLARAAIDEVRRELRSPDAVLVLWAMQRCLRHCVTDAVEDLTEGTFPSPEYDDLLDEILHQASDQFRAEEAERSR